ncbi:MAG: GHKL domain-containing protein [Oscillospiraceae bacterium]|nr:GHKL domain-containing protein [Oscillospiraceae bacterium]
MFSKEWLSMLLQFLILIPGALSCYLPVKNRMRFSERKMIALCCLAAVLFSFIAASAVTAWGIAPNTIGIPILVISFFLYRRTVRLDLPRALAIYVGVCAIETFPVQFGTIADIYFFKSKSEDLTIPGAVVLLGCSCLMLAAFVRPARERFSKAVDEFDIPRLWYSTTIISAIFLVFNILASPASYDVVRNSRLRFIFPMFEVCALALLITVYVLFYDIVTGITEREKLEKRSQLLEMQSHQFRELQEYMRQTARLRHDFRHSVHLLSTLAENGDLDSIRAHLSEYGQRLAESVPVQYCSNAALNALFGYYREMADSEKIRIDWRIELPEPLTFSELDMAALFGNIMENAISACSTLPEGERYFNLTAEIRHGNNLYIVSTNSFDGNVRKGKDGYYSTKHSGHGTGLISIAAAAEKYGGSAQIRNNNNEFFVDVVMKI